MGDHNRAVQKNLSTNLKILSLLKDTEIGDLPILRVRIPSQQEDIRIKFRDFIEFVENNIDWSGGSEVNPDQIGIWDFLRWKLGDKFSFIHTKSPLVKRQHLLQI